MSGVPLPDDWMVEALVAALRDVGCPVPVARRVAGRERLLSRHGEWLALLEGHGIGVELPVEPEDREDAVRHLAEDLAADDAEAADRSARGEVITVSPMTAPGRRRAWPS